MKVKITETRTELTRTYTATNYKGESITATVTNCGYGWKLFWDKVLAKWPSAYLF